MILLSDSKLNLDRIHTLLSPSNYFESQDDRVSVHTYGQLFKDMHDILGLQLSNLELVHRTPYLMTGLLKKGTRLSPESLKRALNGYIHRMSSAGEFNYVAEDIAQLLYAFQRSSDNVKLVTSGE